MIGPAVSKCEEESVEMAQGGMNYELSLLCSCGWVIPECIATGHSMYDCGRGHWNTESADQISGFALSPYLSLHQFVAFCAGLECLEGSVVQGVNSRMPCGDSVCIAKWHR